MATLVGANFQGSWSSSTYNVWNYIAPQAGDVVVVVTSGNSTAPAGWASVSVSSGRLYWAVYSSGLSGTFSGTFTQTIYAVAVRSDYPVVDVEGVRTDNSTSHGGFTAYPYAPDAVAGIAVFGGRTLTATPGGWDTLHGGASLSYHTAVKAPITSASGVSWSTSSSTNSIAFLITYAPGDSATAEESIELGRGLTDEGSASESQAISTQPEEDAATAIESLSAGPATGDTATAIEELSAGPAPIESATASEDAATSDITPQWGYLSGAYEARAKVEVWDGSAWQDISDHIETLRFQDSIDQPGPQVSLDLLPGVSLSLGQPARVSMATWALGEPMPASAWVPLMEGRVTEWDGAGLRATILSQAERLQALYIESEVQVSSGSLESRINYLLSQAGAGETVYAPTPTGVTVDAYGQNTQPVWDAIQRLAALHGFVVRYRWDSASSSWRLTVWDPRTKTTPGVEIGPEHVSSYRAIRTSLQDIRNVIQVQYKSGNDTYVYTGQNDASIAKYGRRWMRLNTSDLPITSSAKAQKVVAAALQDLSEPIATAEVDTTLAPFVRVYDLVKLKPDGFFIAEPVTMGVTRVQHTISARGATTTLTLRGAGVPGLYRFWFRREAGRDGVNPPDANLPPKPPSVWSSTPSVNVVPTVRGLYVYWDRITDPDYLHTEVYFGTSTNPTTLLTTIRGSQVDIYANQSGASLTPGTTYYVRIRHVGKDGRTSPYSSTASGVPGRVGTADLEVRSVTAQHLTAIQVGDLPTTAPSVTSGAVLWAKGLDVYQGSNLKLRVGDLSGLSWKGNTLSSGTYGIWAPEGLVAVGQQVLAQAAYTSQYTISSSTFSDVTNMSVSFTLNETTTVLILYSVEVEANVGITAITSGSYASAGARIEVRVSQSSGPTISNLATDSIRRWQDYRTHNQAVPFSFQNRGALVWAATYTLGSGSYSLSLQASRAILAGSGNTVSGSAYLNGRSLAVLAVR